MSSIYIYTTLELVINMIFVLAQYVFFKWDIIPHLSLPRITLATTKPSSQITATRNESLGGCMETSCYLWRNFLTTEGWHYSPSICGQQGYSKGRETPGKALGGEAQALELVSLQNPTTETLPAPSQSHLSKSECAVPGWRQAWAASQLPMEVISI